MHNLAVHIPDAQRVGTLIQIVIWVTAVNRLQLPDYRPGPLPYAAMALQLVVTLFIFNATTLNLVTATAWLVLIAAATVLQATRMCFGAAARHGHTGNQIPRIVQDAAIGAAIIIMNSLLGLSA